MRSPTLLFAPALLSVVLVSCAGSSVTTSSSKPRSPFARLGKLDVDGDLDSNSKTGYDSDDYARIDFGHAASGIQRQTIATLLSNYYAAGRIANGATACSLVYLLTVEALVEEHGVQSSRSGLRPGVCAPILSNLFREQRRDFLRYTGTLQLVRVRVKGDAGLALFRFGSGPERRMMFHREGSVWKLTSLFDLAPLP